MVDKSQTLSSRGQGTHASITFELSLSTGQTSNESWQMPHIRLGRLVGFAVDLEDMALKEVPTRRPRWGGALVQPRNGNGGKYPN